MAYRVPPPPPGWSYLDDGEDKSSQPAQAPPPAPPAAAPSNAPSRPDPLEAVQSWGAKYTSGFRTPQHNADVGGVPNSRHLDADALDLLPNGRGLTMGKLHALASDYARQWGDPNARAINEGDHVHLQLPGWGNAPGIPAPPPGWSPVDQTQPQPPAAQPTRPPSPAENAAARSLLPQAAPGIAQMIGKHLQDDGSGFTPAPGAAPEEWEHTGYGRLILGQDPSKPQPAPHLDPYRTDRGESVAALPALHIDRAAGKPAMGGGYQTNVDPDKIAAIQSTYEGGASVSDLMAMGAKLEVHLDPKSVLDLVNYRDTYHKAGRFMPDQAAPMDGPRKGETTKDYYDRAFKNQSFDGPYTPNKLLTDPAARMAYSARNTLEALGYGSPDEPVDKVRNAADTATRYAPFVGGARQIIDAAHEAGKGNYANATLMGALGSIDFIPGGGAGLKAGEHVIEGAAIRAASKAADGTLDIARAHEGIRTTVENILQNGGAVELHTPTGIRNIVGSGPKGMVDDAGQRIGFGALLSESRPHSLKITIPDDAGFFPKPRPQVPVTGGPRQSLDAMAMNAAPAPAAPPIPFTPQNPIGLPPVRRPDYIHVNPQRLPDPPPPPMSGFNPGNITPESIVPQPSNRIGSLDEARGVPSSLQPVEAPNEYEVLKQATGGSVPRDIVQRIKDLGGVSDPGGELAAMGIGSAPREGLDFGTDRFSKGLVNPNGMHPDEMTRTLHDEGWFPNSPDRPGLNERNTLYDAIDQTMRGDRVFHPDDQGALERYHAAAEERHRVQQAAQEGAPLVDDVGQPIGLEDARAMDAEVPTHAYEDVATLADRVTGGLNLANVKNGADMVRAQQAIRAELERAGLRSGPKSFEETKAGAYQGGFTLQNLIDHDGRPFTDEEQLASRILTVKAQKDAIEAARRLRASGSDVDRARFERSVNIWAAATAKHEEGQKATARALSAMRIKADPDEIPPDILRDMISNGRGGAKRIDDVAEKMIDLVDNGVTPEGVRRFAVNAFKPTYLDKTLELYYSNMLSAPTTHVANLTGNTMAMALSPVEYGLASVLGQLRRGSSDRVHSGEIGGYIGGLITAIPNALRQFARTAKTGEVTDPLTKIDMRRPEAIGGLKGRIIRTPLRLLSAEDEAFKAVARQGAISRLAVKQARAEGLSGDGFAARVQELSSTPTAGMLRQSADFARYQTFTNEPGAITHGFMKLVNGAPGLKFVAPFVPTIGNLLRYSMERTPVGLILPHVWRELKAGGERRDLAISRMAVGTGLGAIFYKAALEGRITGSTPLDPGTAALWRESGRQEYSVKVGSDYYSYRRFDPIAQVVSMAADLATYDKYLTPREKERGASILAQTIEHNLENASWVGDISKFLSELHRDPLGAASNKAGDVAGTLLVPNIVANPTASYDDKIRDLKPPADDGQAMRLWETMLNRVKSRIPGVRETLPARTNAWGQPIPNEGRAGPDWLVPVSTRHFKNDAVDEDMLSNDLRVGKAGHSVNSIPLSRSQQATYQSLAGRYTHDDWQAFQRTPEWSHMSRLEKQTTFKEVRQAALQDARDDLDLGNPANIVPPPPPPGWK